MEPPTDAAKVSEYLLREKVRKDITLHDWLTAERTSPERADRSWARIARKLHRVTGLYRHEDTVKSWFPELSKPDAAETAEAPPPQPPTAGSRSTEDSDLR